MNVVCMLRISSKSENEMTQAVHGNQKQQGKPRQTNRSSYRRAISIVIDYHEIDSGAFL